MIRVYFSLPKCARNLNSLKRLGQDTGVNSNAKKFSVSVNKEAESIKGIAKGLNETEVEAGSRTEDEREIVSGKGKKSLLSNALSNLKNVSEEGETTVDKVDVSTIINVVEKQASRSKAAGGGKANYEILTRQIKDFLEKNPPKKRFQKPSPEETEKKYAYNQSYQKALQVHGKLSLPESIKLLKNMASEKNRPVEFLKQLSNRILSEENLNIKECSDILYGLAALHYHDEALLSKITDDLCSAIEVCETSAVVGCIFKSLSMLKFRNKVAMEILVEWMKSYKSICRNSDIRSAIMSLAVLNYKPEAATELIQEFSNSLSPDEVEDSSSYLDSVWSLCVLDAASNSQLEYVLAPKFLHTLQKSDGFRLSFSKTVKLLNINGYASHIQKDYKGPLIDNELEKIVNSPKNKSDLTNSVVDALLNLMPSSGYVAVNINSRYGFAIDAEFYVDSKGSPLPLSAKKDGKPGTRITVLTLGYFDMCQGTELVPDGAVALSKRILEAKGCKVLLVPYTECGANKRLIDKVTYLDQKIKELAAS